MRVVDLFELFALQVDIAKESIDSAVVWRSSKMWESPLRRVVSLMVVKHRPGKGGLYSSWSYRPGEGLARPNGWNGAVSQEEGVILPWVDLRTRNPLV